MVNVLVEISGKKIAKISATGHANHKINGQDIVCSAISAVLAGGMNALDGKKHIVLIEKGDTSFTRCGKLSYHDELVLETIITQLISIEKSYPENIKVTIKER